MPPEPSHVAYSDESRYNKGRFRSVAAVSLPLQELPAVSSEFHTSLRGSNVTELSWSRLTSAKYRLAALKLVESSLRLASKGLLRVDVLLWDTHDDRHAVRGRDDLRNLERMYHHLFVSVMRARWPDQASWLLRPDEQSALDWQTVKRFLRVKEHALDQQAHLIAIGDFFAGARRRYRILDIEEADSAQHVLVQLADLFAGVAPFSRESYDTYEAWAVSAGGQLTLLPSQLSEPQTTSSERERFQLIKEFDRHCKQRKLGVSLRTHRGLRTLDPRRPINFWWYEPQGDYDTAPTRTS